MPTRSLRTALLLCLPLCQCAKEADAPPVGVLRTSTHEYVLHAGPEGTLYTVKDLAGRVVAKTLSAAQLAAQHPTLSEDLDSLYAGNRRLESSPLRKSTESIGLRWNETVGTRSETSGRTGALGIGAARSGL